MTFTLRPYQQEAVDATLAWFRRHTEPAAIVLPTGAGKSLVIAELARLARGRVLVLAHVKELVAQNHAKYCALGLEADIFAAGLQRKESHGKVVFGSVQSVARNLDQFRSEFSLLIVDECHLGKGCNRPPVLRTASLYGWRGIKALAMFCGLGPPGELLRVKR